MRAEEGEEVGLDGRCSVAFQRSERRDEVDSAIARKGQRRGVEDERSAREAHPM